MGRLIDADAAINERRELIKAEEEKIKRWESRRNDCFTIDVDEKIRMCRKNITELKAEIKMLKNCETAYDVEEVIRNIDRLQVGKPTPEEYNLCVRDAIGIVRKGGIKL